MRCEALLAFGLAPAFGRRHVMMDAGAGVILIIVMSRFTTPCFGGGPYIKGQPSSSSPGAACGYV